MDECNLPAFLASVPLANVADSDGEIERAAYRRLRAQDNIGAARLALRVQSPIRRAAWLQNFRPATIARASAQGIEQ